MTTGEEQFEDRRAWGRLPRPRDHHSSGSAVLPADRSVDDPDAGREQIVMRRTIRDIERGLVRDDPDFARRMRWIQVHEVVNAFAVYMLFAVSAVLLMVGMATQTWSALLAGAAVYLISFRVDAHHQRSVRRMRRK